MFLALFIQKYQSSFVSRETIYSDAEINMFGEKAKFRQQMLKQLQAFKKPLLSQKLRDWMTSTFLYSACLRLLIESTLDIQF